jgi:hypothetical protein
MKMAHISYLWHISNQIDIVIQSLDGEQFTTPLPMLSGATIGKHTRHIIDAFATVERGINQSEISFDERTRDLRTENDRAFASNLMKQFATKIEVADVNRKIILLNDFSHAEKKEIIRTETTLGRELIYAIEHAIHHLAIIKIGIEQCLGIPLPSGFGVAPSTIRFQSHTSQ